MSKPHPPSRDVDRWTARSFADWNEEMVRRYDIERYYEESHAVVRWLEALRLRELIGLAAPTAQDRVLEVGCGAGHALERFSGQARVGIDLSATMLERARRRLGADVVLLRASAEQLPFAAGSFDILICTEVLEHTLDPAQVIRELVRVAGARGRVVVSIPNESSIDRAKRVLRRIPWLRQVLKTLADEGNEWHLHRLDRGVLRCITAGTARIERLRTIPSALVPLHYVVLLRAT